MAERSQKARPRRTWWQRLLRAAGLTALAAVGAYVTFPWWLPTGWLADRLERQLSEQTRSPVRVGRVSLSWADGVSIRELAIGGPDSPGVGPLVYIDRLDAPLTPLRTLATGRLEWMEIRDLRLNVQVTEDGQSNLAPLTRFGGGLEADRVSVLDSRLLLHLPDRPRPLRLDITSGQVGGGGGLRLTATGRFKQPGSSARASLRLRHDPDTGEALNTSLTFEGFQLRSLPLNTLLALPAESITGRASGMLAVQIDSQGRASRMDLDVGIAQLDVRPIGKVDLPVIQTARVKMSGTLDVVTGKLAIRTGRLVLPGIDISGKGTAYVDSGSGVLRGFQDFQLRGKVYPDRLAALLTGSGQLGGQVAIEGPMGVRVEYDRQAGPTDLKAYCDLQPCRISHAGRTIKPAGRVCSVRVNGRGQRRPWRIAVTGPDGLRVRLGGNTFAGRGELLGLEQTLAAAIAGRHLAPGQLAVRLARGLRWQGRWHVEELASLADLHPALAAALERVKLDGPITGRLDFGTPAAMALRLRCQVPEGTSLTARPWLVKPAAGAASVALAGRVLAEGALGLADGDLDLAVNDGWLRAWGLHLTADANGRTAAAGRFEIDRPQRLMARSPVLTRFAGMAEGVCSGTFSASRLGRRAAAEGTCVLTDTRLHLAPWFAKPADRRLELRFSASDDGRLQRLALAATAEAGRFALAGVSPDRWTDKAAWRWTARIEDLPALASWSPRFQAVLAGGRLSGQLDANGLVGYSRSAFQWRGSANLTEAGFAPAIPGWPGKAPGAKATLSTRLDRWASPKAATESISGQACLALGGSRLTLDGHALRVQPDPPGLGPLGSLAVDREHVRQAEVELTAHAELDAPTRSAAPWLDRLARAVGASGQFDANARVRYKGGRYTAAGRIDANALDIDRAVFDANAAVVLAKPRQMPASLQWRVASDGNARDLRLLSSKVRFGPLAGTAAGRVQLGADANNPLTITDGRLALSSRDLRGLHRALPALEGLAPEGAVFADVRFDWSPASGLAAERVDLHLAPLSVTHHGRRATARGGLRLDDLRWNPRPDGPPEWSLGRARVQGLRLSAGENRAMLLADVTGLPDAPRGEATVVAGYLDDRDLSDWLAGRGDANTASEANETDADRRRKRIAEARDLIAAVRGPASRADLNLRLKVDAFRTFDPAVKMHFLLRRMDLRTLAREGVIESTVRTALAGGIYQARSKVNLDTADPELAMELSLQDMLATDAIGAQFQMHFPGNSLYGGFSRTESTRAPLDQVLASVLDPRVAVYKTGTAKVVANDGLVEGRAAPEFVTALLPGLKLAKYPYRRMTGFAEYRPDGVVANDLVFNGQSYDIYMEGQTTAENVAQYEVGIVLLSLPQTPEWNHRFRQGRVPLLEVRSKFEDGKIIEENVSYPLPTETAFTIFLKNNLLYRILLDVQQNRKP